MTRIAGLLLILVLAGCNGSGAGGADAAGGTDGGDGNGGTGAAPPVPDQGPIVTVAEPLDWTVATPEVRVTASCTDDQGDCSLAVYVDSTFGDTLQVGGLGSELSREFDLSDFDGQTVIVDVIAIDSAGQARSEVRFVHVEGSPDLTNETAFPLSVIDFDGQRALLEREIDLLIGLSIFEVASGIEANVPVPGQFKIQEAYLTPTGAVFAGFTEADARVYDWNHSLLVELGPIAGMETCVGFGDCITPRSLEVAGDYATWNNGRDGDLHRWQFSTMTDLVVAGSAGGDSVASSGVVVFSERPSLEARAQIVKFDGGVYTTLTADADRHNLSARTDGQGVVYYKAPDTTPDNDVYEIAFHDGTGETILTGPGPERPEPGSDYAIAGGWVAFTEPGELGQMNVWTRDPSGALLQRTAFDVDSLIEALAPDGEVMVVTTENRTLGKSAGIARYLSRPTGELTQVSSALGWSTRIGDTWYVIIGRSVFEVR